MSQEHEALFAGEYRHSLDAKNRVTIPAKWRFEGDETQAYLAIPNPNGSITLYPPKMASELRTRLSTVSLGDLKGQRAINRVFRRSDSMAPDKQGRINLTDSLCRHAGLEKEALMLGAVSVFHIWEPGRFERYLGGEDEPTPEEQAFYETLQAIGL